MSNPNLTIEYRRFGTRGTGEAYQQKLSLPGSKSDVLPSLIVNANTSVC
jgi:hypothetical protein